MLYSTHEPLPCASQVPHAVKPPDNGTRYAVVGYADQKVVAAARLQAAGVYQLKGGSEANKAFRQRFEDAKAAEIARRASVASTCVSAATTPATATDPIMAFVKNLIENGDLNQLSQREIRQKVAKAFPEHDGIRP